MGSLNRQIDQLEVELRELVTGHRPALLAEQGCGALTAAILIGHAAGVKAISVQTLELRAPPTPAAAPIRLLLRSAPPSTG